MNNSDMPAGVCPDVHHANGQLEYGHSGLTKREHFAGLAMQGMLTNPGDYSKPEHVAHDAIMYADAILAALEQEQAK